MSVSFWVQKYRNDCKLNKTAAAWSQMWSIAQLIFMAYTVILKGKVHTGNSAAQLQYPLTAQATFFLFQTKPQLPHC